MASGERLIGKGTIIRNLVCAGVATASAAIVYDGGTEYKAGVDRVSDERAKISAQVDQEFPLPTPQDMTIAREQIESIKAAINSAIDAANIDSAKTILDQDAQGLIEARQRIEQHGRNQREKQRREMEVGIYGYTSDTDDIFWLKITGAFLVGLSSAVTMVFWPITSLMERFSNRTKRSTI